MQAVILYLQKDQNQSVTVCYALLIHFTMVNRFYRTFVSTLLNKNCMPVYVHLGLYCLSGFIIYSIKIWIHWTDQELTKSDNTWSAEYIKYLNRSTNRVLKTSRFSILLKSSCSRSFSVICSSLWRSSSSRIRFSSSPSSNSSKADRLLFSLSESETSPMRTIDP